MPTLTGKPILGNTQPIAENTKPAKNSRRDQHNGQIRVGSYPNFHQSCMYIELALVLEGYNGLILYIAIYKAARLKFK